MLVVSEDTVVKALLVVNADLLNGQLFQKSKTQNCQRFLEVNHLRSGLLSNIARLRLIQGLRLFKNSSNFKTDFRCQERH